MPEGLYNSPGGVRNSRVRKSGKTDTYEPVEEQTEELQEEVLEVSRRYNPQTIASDLLRVLGEHPTLPPLNSHIDGYDDDSKTLKRPRLRLRLRDPKPPTDVTPIDERYSLRQYEGDEAVTVGAAQEASTAKWKAQRGNEEAQEKSVSSAEEESNSIGPSQASRLRLDQNPNSNGMSIQSQPAPQPVALPRGWHGFRFPNGRPYFVDHLTQIITIDDPRLIVQPRPLTRLGALPTGWEMRFRVTLNGPRIYFVDHNTRTTTWNDPRQRPL